MHVERTMPGMNVLRSGQKNIVADGSRSRQSLCGVMYSGSVSLVSLSLFFRICSNPMSRSGGEPILDLDKQGDDYIICISLYPTTRNGQRLPLRA
jgi:hypothetical protein